MNLPPPQYDFEIISDNGKIKVRCLVRNRLLLLSPEEWVRQHVLHVLIHELAYPKGKISVEKTIEVNSLTKRFDILVYNNANKPSLLVECKAAHIAVNQETLNQIGRYNVALSAKYLLVTNWDKWIVAEVDKEKGSFSFLEKLPSYDNL